MRGKIALVLFILSVSLFLGGGLPPREAIGSNGTVGSEICKGGHEDRFKTYSLSTHSKKGIPGSPANQDGCESCHDPGTARARPTWRRAASAESEFSSSAKESPTRGPSPPNAFPAIANRKIYPSGT